MNTCHVLKTLIPAAIIACLSGCTPGFDIDEFETADELGLIIKGKYVLRYDETNFQIGSNADKNIFWITDDDMADYFIVTCSSFPQAGDQVKADLIYTTDSDVKEKTGMKFEVIESDPGTGLVKIWNKSSRTGVYFKALR